MAGISPGLLLPLLPVGLMLVSQLFSLIPFLLKVSGAPFGALAETVCPAPTARSGCHLSQRLVPVPLQNIHMLVLLFFVPGEWRRPLVMLLLFAMMVGKLGP